MRGLGNGLVALLDGCGGRERSTGCGLLIGGQCFGCDNGVRRGHFRGDALLLGFLQRAALAFLRKRVAL